MTQPQTSGTGNDTRNDTGNDAVDEITKGYTFDSAAIELGVLVVNDQPAPDAKIRIPLGMLNRHGLVAGATGTGKTKTLQLMAEQICAAGVPVFAADVKGDLSGIASPGQPSDRLTSGGRQRQQKSMVEEIAGNPMVRSIARTAGREIIRGLFGTARRRR